MIRTSMPVAEIGHHHARQRAGPGKQHRFRQHLPHQPAAAGAQPHAHRQFPLPPRRPRQQHARHVDARQQQQQAHHRPSAAPAVCRTDRAPAPGRRPPAPLPPGLAGPSRCSGRRSAPPSDRYSTRISACACCRVTPGFDRASMSHGVLLIRNPDVGPRSHARSDVPARRHTDDGLRRVVHEDPFAQNRRIAMEPAVPLRPAHHRHVCLAARRDILRTGQPPDRRLQSEHLEVIPQHALLESPFPDRIPPMRTLARLSNVMPVRAEKT